MNITEILLIVAVVFLFVISILILFSQNKLKNDNEKMGLNLQSNIRQIIEKQFREIISVNAENAQKQIKENTENTQKLSDRIAVSLNEIRQTNEKKLDEIQKNVNEKLDKSLNERLDSSFKTIGEELQSLHKNLGELKSLSSGVDSLQKTLSNVKTRGVYGEMQLENILANIMDKSQYVTQYMLNKGENSRVDFAVKIPDKQNENGFVYLPIDAKFPSDKYLNIVKASEECDTEGLKNAVRDLKAAVELQAKSIRDKYLNPPNTTNFAIMFLPTESLYAEVLKIEGLAEKCQNEYNIVIQGPTTITALINSFSIGFKYLVMNKKTAEIEKTLQAIKTQYNTFSDLITKTKKKLKEATEATDLLSDRNEMISKKLKNYEALDVEASNKELELQSYIE